MFAHSGRGRAAHVRTGFIYYELIQSGVVLKKDESADGKGQRLISSSSMRSRSSRARHNSMGVDR